MRTETPTLRFPPTQMVQGHRHPSVRAGGGGFCICTPPVVVVPLRAPLPSELASPFLPAAAARPDDHAEAA